MANTRYQLNEFFISVQRRALRQAELAVGNREDALDILQDAMIRLAKSYSDKPDDWPKLFQRILQNLIRDWYRKQKVRKLFSWWGDSRSEGGDEVDDSGTLIDQADTPALSQNSQGPHTIHSQNEVAEQMVAAVESLPLRQQQAFTLRAWWGHDVNETAFAMGCSEGSVKTHYSRALTKLREILGDYEP